MKAKTVIQWLIIAGVVWWVVTQPSHAMHLVSNIGNLLSSAARGLAHLAASI